MTQSKKYRRITDTDFEQEVVVGRKPSILLFGAEWSGNSEMMDSMMERVSAEFNSGIKFYKVDLEEHVEISKFFGVYSVPTMIMLKEGEVVEFIKGFIPAKKVREKIKVVFDVEK